MNKNHRSIWNAKTNSWVAVSEKSTTKGKKSKTLKKSKFSLIHLLGSTAVIASSCLSHNAYADPTVCYESPYSDTETVGTTGNDVSYCASGELSGWEGQGGNDTLSLRNVIFNNYVPADFTTSGTINMGSGNDQVKVWIYNSSSSSTPQTTVTIAPDTVINTLDGEDIVDFTNIGSNLSINESLSGTINLGKGNDKFYTDGNLTINTKINGDEGDDEFNLGSTTISNSNNRTQATINGDISGGSGNDRFTLDLGVRMNGTIDGGADTDSFNLVEGSAKNVNGGSGNDYFTIRNSFSYSDSNLVLDGGTGEDNLSFDALTGSIKAENLVNFESFNVGGFSKLNFTGNQLTIQNSTDPNSYNTIGIDEGSELSFSSNSFTIAGGKGLSNRGTLNLRGAAPGRLLTIEGDYEASNNSSILVNAQLGGDYTPIDKLLVKGNTSGKSKIFIANVGGTGGATSNGINVIEVRGNSEATFTLGNKVEAGNYEYFLFKSGKNWFLESFDPSNPDNCEGCSPTPRPTPTPTPSPTPTPTPSPSPTPTSTPRSAPKQPIYRPAIAGYVLAAPVQFDQTVSLIGTYEQRQAKLDVNSDIWGRVNTLQTSSNSSSFSYDHTSHNIQFGKVIHNHSVDQELNSETGITAAIGQQNADYFDAKRQFTSSGKLTGQSSTSSFSLGAYYTQTKKDKPYLDFQAYLSNHNSQLKDVNNNKAKQKGLGLALSAEIGKAIILSTSGLELSPQVQFIFQSTSYDGFTDNVSSISKQTAESLRVRAGVTLQSNKAKASKTNWSTSLNLWQELIENPSRVISGAVVTPEQTSKPWLELGLGVNHQLSESSSLSTQISIQNSLSGNQRRANAFNLSYRLKW